MGLDERLVDLLIEAEDLRARGCPVQAAELCRDCPELAAELERLLHGTDAIEQLLQPSSATQVVRSEPASTIPLDHPPNVRGYRIVREIGKGGMGVVFAAVDVTLERRVALKIMLPERADDHKGVERFIREGRAAVKLTSDHVARVYEVGATEGAAFLAMEYLDGQDLEALLHRTGPIAPSDAADYVLQACDAIAAQANEDPAAAPHLRRLVEFVNQSERGIVR